jgi:hypothetical protein
LFFVPLLFLVGVAGFAGRRSADDVSTNGVTGSLAVKINDALSQRGAGGGS